MRGPWALLRVGHRDRTDSFRAQAPHGCHKRASITHRRNNYSALQPWREPGQHALVRKSGEFVLEQCSGSGVGRGVGCLSPIYIYISSFCIEFSPLPLHLQLVYLAVPSLLCCFIILSPLPLHFQLIYVDVLFLSCCFVIFSPLQLHPQNYIFCI